MTNSYKMLIKCYLKLVLVFPPQTAAWFLGHFLAHLWRCLPQSRVPCRTSAHHREMALLSTWSQTEQRSENCTTKWRSKFDCRKLQALLLTDQAEYWDTVQVIARMIFLCCIQEKGRLTNNQLQRRYPR